MSEYETYLRISHYLQTTLWHDYNAYVFEMIANLSLIKLHVYSKWTSIPGLNDWWKRNSIHKSLPMASPDVKMSHVSVIVFVLKWQLKDIRNAISSRLFGYQSIWSLYFNYFLSTDFFLLLLWYTFLLKVIHYFNHSIILITDTWISLISMADE